MTMHEMLTRMSSVELSQRIALNNIKVKEQTKAAEKAKRMSRAKRR